MSPRRKAILEATATLEEAKGPNIHHFIPRANSYDGRSQLLREFSRSQAALDHVRPYSLGSCPYQVASSLIGGFGLPGQHCAWGPFLEAIWAILAGCPCKKPPTRGARQRSMATFVSEVKRFRLQQLQTLPIV